MFGVNDYDVSSVFKAQENVIYKVTDNTNV
jgi:hypothetical protein